MKENPKLVFVGLGRLNDYAIQNIQLAAQRIGSSADTVLISDHFPSALRNHSVAHIDARQLLDANSRRALADKLEAVGKNSRWRKRYWLGIMGRFEILGRYCSDYLEDTPVLHLENDVESFITPQIFEALGDLQPSIYGLNQDEDNICPGLLWSVSSKRLGWVCKEVVELVVTGSASSDMHALARLRALGFVSTLPSFPTESAITTGCKRSASLVRAKVVFDTNPVGQYLFGIDPRNEGGIRIPGIRLKVGSHDASLFSNWQLSQCEDGISRISAEFHDTPVTFANLHMHSKTQTPASSDLAAWQRILNVANGLATPTPEILWGLYVSSRIRASIRNLLRKQLNAADTGS